MLNPDGVALGNYRADSGGADLNRAWLSASEACYPANRAVLGLLHHYAYCGGGSSDASINGDADDESRDTGASLAVLVDVHAHSTSRCSFLFCNQPPLVTGLAGSGPDPLRLPRYAGRAQHAAGGRGSHCAGHGMPPQGAAPVQLVAEPGSSIAAGLAPLMACPHPPPVAGGCRAYQDPGPVHDRVQPAGLHV
jgi:hypothetical protein